MAWFNFFAQINLANIRKSKTCDSKTGTKFCTANCLQFKRKNYRFRVREPAPPPPKKIITPSKYPKSYHAPLFGKA